jgi:hypothetical protein
MLNKQSKRVEGAIGLLKLEKTVVIIIERIMIA